LKYFVGGAGVKHWTRPYEQSSLTCGAMAHGGLGTVAACAVKILELNYRQRDFYSLKRFKMY